MTTTPDVDGESNEPEPRPRRTPDPLDIQDYLDASGDAAARTRNASISLVVASVLVFAGLLNSLQSSWMLQRLEKSSNPFDGYVATKIGPPPDRNDRDEMSAYQERYRQFYGALVRTYVENSYVVRVPFFGFAIDANDLGLVGGIGFIAILVMFRFCISREVDNLRMSFDEADELGQLEEFYKLLSMRQVLTIPPNDFINRTGFLIWTPKLICFAPVIVYGVVLVHDFMTAGIGAILSDQHTRILFVCEGCMALAIFVLTIMVVTRLRRLDNMWVECWNQVQGNTTRPSGRLSPAPATSFTSAATS